MSEDAEQMALMAKLHVAKWRGHPLSDFAFAVPNGGSRHPAEGAKLKRMGVLAGVPDLIVPIPAGRFHGLGLELKAQGGRLQPSQREYLAKLRWLGWQTAVAFGADEAFAAITRYLADTGHPVHIGYSPDPQIDWATWEIDR
jgi:hypothetical protein